MYIKQYISFVHTHTYIYTHMHTHPPMQSTHVYTRTAHTPEHITHMYARVCLCVCVWVSWVIGRLKQSALGKEPGSELVEVTA